MIPRLTSDGTRIVTDYWAKPIAVRDFDWTAITDEYDGAPDAHCPIGLGATEQEAVADLLDQLGEARP